MEELERRKLQQEKEAEEQYFKQFKRNKNGPPPIPPGSDNTQLVKLRFTDALLDKTLSEILPKANTDAIRQLRSSMLMAYLMY